ncbi:nitrite reductase small subunit NirD [Edaphovirga cremea]|uniref:nitrite reductase small subunit NirD n=1 Tax=Edaphovirga cremea TaxID=2267246 RepID=UPI000DEF2207|nr:nitrite reductase small subunit NirD [Edaphovirga cremea]
MSQWNTVCPLEDILPATGVCALVGDRQIALFRPYQDQQIFALSNIDPFAQASVLSRGLIAEHQGDLWITSPLKKQHFRLHDGYCLEDGGRSIPRFDTRVVDGIIQVKSHA